MSISPTPTPAQLAEQSGSQLASNALNAMAAVSSQGQRLSILHDTILTLADSTHPEQCIGGFAACMVNVIERGLEAISNDRR